MAIDYSKANAPLAKDLYADDVGASAFFLCSPLANAVTGITLYVDNGLHCMGMAVDSQALSGTTHSASRVHLARATPPFFPSKNLSSEAARFSPIYFFPPRFANFTRSWCGTPPSPKRAVLSPSQAASRSRSRSSRSRSPATDRPRGDRNRARRPEPHTRMALH